MPERGPAGPRRHRRRLLEALPASPVVDRLSTSRRLAPFPAPNVSA